MTAILRTRLQRLALLAGGVSIAFCMPVASMFGSRDPLAIVLILALLVISLGIHEAAHAYVAWKCGDSTAKDMGRMTLNPIVHIDPIWTIAIPALAMLTSGFIFGGAKPVPVNFHRLKHPWRDMSIVAFAGPLSNLCLAAVFYALWKFFVQTGMYNGAAPASYLRSEDLLPRVLSAAVSFNLLLFVFNLIPVPPLDGSRILTWLLPDSLRETYNAIGAFGLIIVFLLMRWDAFNELVYSAIDVAAHWVHVVVTLGGHW